MRNWILFLGGLALLGLAALVIWSGAASESRSISEPRLEAVEGAEPTVAVPLDAASSVPDDSRRDPVEHVSPADSKSVVDKASIEEPEAAESRARIVGRCIDRSQVAVGGVQISSGDSKTITDADGRFELELVFEGIVKNVKLAFQREDFADDGRDFKLRAGELYDLGAIVLDGAAVVYGLVTDDAGVPIVEAQVQIEEARSVVRGHRFTGVSDPRHEGVTDAEGRFRLERVAPGSIRVWAGATDRAWGTSDVHELEVGEEYYVELVPPLLEREATIDLLIVDPNGEPVPGAQVQFHYHTSNRSGSGSDVADDAGRLRKFLKPQVPHSFLASHPDGTYGPAGVEDVAPGTRDLVIALRPLEFFELVVTSGADLPLERFTARLHDVEAPQNSLVGSSDAESQADGRVDIVKPPFSFDVRVEAEGHATGKLGPFLPEAMPDVVRVELQRLPGIRGRVTGLGQALEGAAVSLHAAEGMRNELEINGFKCRSSKGYAARSKSESDGTFELTLRSAGAFYLRAESEGFASWDVGPFELDPRAGAEGLDIDLGRGGVIEGRVLVHPGEMLADWVVGVSRGDGYGVTQRTNEKGEFRFTGLAAGDWLVEQREKEISPNSTTSSSSASETPQVVPSNCVVREGATTTHVIDLRALQDAVLVGRLLLGGQAASSDDRWTATLRTMNDEQVGDSAVLDSSGRFRLAASTPGRFQLAVRSEQGSVFASFRDELDLAAGDNEWERDVPVGRLEGQATPETIDWQSSVRYTWSDAMQFRFDAQIFAGENGSLAVDALPAGPGVLSFSLSQGEREQRDVVIPPGGTLTLDLP